MSRMTLTRRRVANVHWNDEVEDAELTEQSEVRPEFEALDRVLTNVDAVLELSHYDRGDRWYIITDDDVTTAEDASPTFGLDSWDF
jgi:hypothetical protein